MDTYKKAGWSQEQITIYREKSRQKYHDKRAMMTPDQIKSYNEKRAQSRKNSDYWQRHAEKKRCFKKLCLDYKGSKCENCGLIDIPAVYDFHHSDPKEKDFNIAMMRGWCSISGKVKKELDKCKLLCANCHRRVHAEERTGP